MSAIYIDSYLRGNFGDDLFVYIICKKYPNIEFYSYSDRGYRWLQEELPNLLVDGRFAGVPDKLAHALSIITRSARCDEYVRLGGSIFIQGKRKSVINRALGDLFYRAYVRIVIVLYRYVYVLGANYGPSETDYYDESNRILFRASRDVCFRDEESYNRFCEVDVVRYAPDIVFTLDVPENKKERRAFVSVVDVRNRKKFDFDDDAIRAYEAGITDCCVDLASLGYRIVLSGFCFHEGDFSAADRFAAILSERGVGCEIINYDCNLGEIINEIGKSELLIGTRFHSIVLGMLSGCKVLPVVYSEKTTNLLKSVGFPKQGVYEIGSSSRDLRLCLDVCMDSDVIDVSELKRTATTQFSRIDERLGGLGAAKNHC